MKKNTKYFLGGLAVLGLLVWLGIATFDFSRFTDKPLTIGGGADDGDDDTVILAQIQPALKPQPKSHYNGTILSGGTCTAFIDGVKASCTAGTAFNVAQGSQYEVLYDDGQHYQAFKSGSSPINGEALVSLDSQPNGTLSSVFYNSAGTAATAQALVAGDEKFVKVRLTATNDKVFSNPQSPRGPVLCFDYNTTEIDKIEVNGQAKASIPQQAVGTYEECYTAPFISLADGKEFDLTLLVDADDSVNPAGDATMIVYDQDLFLVTTGANIDAREYGVEDSSGTDIGGSNPTVTLDFS